MTFEEYRRYDALGLAELVRKGEVPPTTLLELAIERAEMVNPQINAIIHPLYDLALEMAGRIDRKALFAGVPFLIKDLGLEVKGTPRRSGSKGFRGYVSDHDSYLVEDYRKAGLLFLGKTNTPEFGTTPFTEPELYGPTMTGQPSMSVPLYWNEKNLPVGAMFTGPIGREDLLIRLAGQLERARPWFNRIPPL